MRRRVATGACVSIVGALVLVLGCAPGRDAGRDTREPADQAQAPETTSESDTEEVERSRWKPSQKDIALLPVGLDENEECILLARTPDTIRTTYGDLKGTAQWIIVGNCGPDDKITINPRFRYNGEENYELAAEPIPEVAARHGERVQMRMRPKDQVKPPAPSSGQPGVKYEYQVWINGRVARFNSDTYWGSFEVCPDWPCRNNRF